MNFSALMLNNIQKNTTNVVKKSNNKIAVNNQKNIVKFNVNVKHNKIYIQICIVKVFFNVFINDK